MDTIIVDMLTIIDIIACNEVTNDFETENKNISASNLFFNMSSCNSLLVSGIKITSNNN